MENYRKYIPVNCWKCGKMNNFAVTKSCTACGIYLKTSSNGENGSNLHNDSILENPVAKSALVLAGIFVVFLTAGLLLNKGLPSFSDNLPDFSIFGEKSGDKPDTSPVKKNLFADKLNKTYVALKKGNLPSSSWYKNSWWSYVRKYPTVQQIFEKNTEATGKKITIEDVQSIYLTGVISIAETKCFDDHCKNNVTNPNAYTNPTLSFDTLNDYSDKPYVKLGEMEMFADKSGKLSRIVTIAKDVSKTGKKVQIKEVFNGTDSWKQMVSYNDDGTNSSTFEKLDREKSNELEKDMQALWKSANYDSDSEVLGFASVGEGTSFVVKEKNRDVTHYFDTVSGLLTREDRDDMTAFFADFRMLEDSMTPYAMYFRKGRPSHDTFSWAKIEISEWKLNSEYDKAIFTMPEK